MDLGLEGKKAIVTGGTRGIGRTIAELLADEGCDLGICARGEAAIGPAVAALKAKGVNATGAVVDVSDADAVMSWVEQAATALDGLDIVIANASGFGITPDAAGWRQGFEVDIMGTFHTVQAAMPHLERSDAGAILAISSVAALEFFGGARPYNSVKAALINYISNLSIELAPKGIRANTVSPGTIYFDGGVWQQRERDEPEVFKMALARNPMGRMGGPDEVAKAAVFLASPAAGFISGTNLIVDGALTQGVQY
ncbi:MAG: SDR family NAD(P)-dependent oxidoreductase [Alphaproteobacteria bacterium]|jgi:NAD(P)-dependent dehydrogenase (short-subunit alcohol dehydrogenase family)|nr:SDR family NAD(P)-dependent oxidoreductase [Alphaproteobacteria bacterium]MDP6517903.1 SDR family NAD(P)-dependent oxidoreductase [Alphaproteobacteria bacterium]